MKTVKLSFLCISLLVVMKPGVKGQAPANDDAAYTKAITPFITRLDNASSVTAYQSLANDFTRLAGVYTKEWSAFYYSAYCNARIAWLYQEKPGEIEPYAKLAETQIRNAETLAGASGNNSGVLSEIFCIWSMVDRAYVFISPMSNGRKYGPASNQYIEKAKKANPNNARAFYLDAWVNYYTPKLWGGDKAKAKELLGQALVKLNSPAPSAVFPHWGKTDCDALLAQFK